VYKEPVLSTQLSIPLGLVNPVLAV